MGDLCTGGVTTVVASGARDTAGGSSSQWRQQVKVDTINAFAGELLTLTSQPPTPLSRSVDLCAVVALAVGTLACL